MYLTPFLYLTPPLFRALSAKREIFGLLGVLDFFVFNPPLFRAPFLTRDRRGLNTRNSSDVSLKNVNHLTPGGVSSGKRKTQTG